MHYDRYYMEKTVQTLTQRYLGLLSGVEASIDPNSLRDYKLPPLFCEWIRCELELKLDRDLRQPKTEWSEMDSEKIQQSWNAFESAVRAAIRIPGDRLEEVVRSSVQGFVSLAIQPRKRVPELLFGPDKTIAPDKLAERAGRVLVHPHLARAMVRYVERKELNVLERGQCERVLVQVDDRLADRYNALDWVDCLDPLFVLVGEELPTELLRLFFEDKKRYKAARRFDLMRGGVTRNRLIETLSSPDLLEESDEEEPMLFDASSDSEEPGDSLNSRFMFDQPRLDPDEDEKDSQVEADRKEQRPIGFAADWEELAEFPESDESEQHPVQDKPEEAENTDKLKEDSLEEGSSDVRQPDEDVEEKSGLAGWYAPQDAGDDDEPEPDDESGLAASYVQQNDGDGDEAKPQHGEENEGSDDGTIWKQFLQEPEEEETESPPGLRLVDTLDRHQRLREWIGEDARRYQKELFQGSEKTFQAAIRDLAEQENWKEAAAYIQNEIFAKQKVDMFEDAAVDFTDQMQEWYERLDDGPE